MENNEENFEYKYNRDPNLQPDTKIKIGDKEVNFDYITENFPINKEQPVSMLVYWDDICQFTSLGLIELLNALFKTNAKIDIEHFFNRPNQYVYGIDYVYKLFEKTLDKKTIDDIKYKYYWKLLEMSVRSSLFGSIIKTNTFISRIGFYFPFRFQNCDALRIGLNKQIFNDKNPDGVQFYYGNQIGFNELLKNGYNSIVTPNINSTYKYILDNNIKKIAIISTEEHNGISEETGKLLAKLGNRPKPNYCSISLYKEEFFL